MIPGPHAIGLRRGNADFVARRVHIGQRRLRVRSGACFGGACVWGGPCACFGPLVSGAQAHSADHQGQRVKWTSCGLLDSGGVDRLIAVSAIPGIVTSTMVPRPEGARSIDIVPPSAATRCCTSRSRTNVKFLPAAAQFPGRYPARSNARQDHCCAVRRPLWWHARAS